MPSSTLTSSLTSGNRAVEAIIDYDTSLSMTQKALDLTTAANQTVKSTLISISALSNNGVSTIAEILLNTSMELLSEAEQTSDIVMELISAVSMVRYAYRRAVNQTQEIANLTIMLNRDANALAQAVSTNEDFINSILNTIHMSLDIVEDIYDSTVNIIHILEQNFTRAQLELNTTEMVSNFIMYSTVLMMVLCFIYV